MSSAYLKSKMEERAGLSDLVTGTLDRCATDSREPTAEERARLDQWRGQITALDAEIVQLRTQLEADDRFTQIISATARREEDHERREQQRTPENRTRPRSWGAQFVESDAFKAYRGRGTMEPVEFEGFLEQRAAIDTSVLDLPPYLWDGPRGYVTTTPLLNAIGREVVSSGSIEYITWGTSDPSAEVVAEGALKPEADIVPTTTPLSLETYAHWKGITRQALEDYPRIQSIVEGKLRGGLADALEQAAADVITAAAFPAVSGPDLVSGIRLAIGEVQAAGYQPNAILLNPADFAQLDIDASASGNNGPISYGTFWGIRPVPVGALPAGTSYVGDFNEAVTWFDRNTASVYMTDSHADYFVRNILVVLAEQRSAFAATELTAAAKVTVAAAPEAATTTTAKSTAS